MLFANLHSFRLLQVRQYNILLHLNTGRVIMFQMDTGLLSRIFTVILIIWTRLEGYLQQNNAGKNWKNIRNILRSTPQLESLLMKLHLIIPPSSPSFLFMRGIDTAKYHYRQFRWLACGSPL